VLTLHGEFTPGQVFVYVRTSLVPIRAVAKQGRVDVAVKPSDSPMTVTVYQGAGLCDSMVVSVKQTTSLK
jgi:hypothetical protein